MAQFSDAFRAMTTAFLPTAALAQVVAVRYPAQFVGYRHGALPPLLVLEGMRYAALLQRLLSHLAYRQL